MANISISRPREIVDDFVKEINIRKTEGPKPEVAVINFRNDIRDGVQRKVYNVPIDLLRYRKYNGRIISDVLNYEKNFQVLDEKAEETQAILKKFLEDKDKEKTEDLKKTIQHSGQREPAIITCDGFLINGNRRKMVIEMLKIPNATMKVVILPGKNDQGGSPTLLEIEQIENRYQLQSEGKAEYSHFDKALSMRYKIQCGMSLEDQLRDDPVYANLVDEEFKKSVREIRDNFLEPLNCIDRYLEGYLGKPGMYTLISRSSGDSEGRWQAFLDYYNYVYKNLNDENKRVKLGIEEDEIGSIEDVAFKIIRKREFPDLGKVHKIMRDFTKWLKTDESKKELLKLTDIDWELKEKECIDADGKERDPRDIDLIWGKKNEQDLIWRVKNAKKYFENKKDRETPLDLLEDALKKLEHPDMDTSSISISEIPKAMHFTNKIIAKAKDLEHEFYSHKKNYDELKEKGQKKKNR